MAVYRTTPTWRKVGTGLVNPNVKVAGYALVHFGDVPTDKDGFGFTGIFPGTLLSPSPVDVWVKGSAEYNIVWVSATSGDLVDSDELYPLVLDPFEVSNVAYWGDANVAGDAPYTVVDTSGTPVVLTNVETNTLGVGILDGKLNMESAVSDGTVNVSAGGTSYSVEVKLLVNTVVVDTTVDIQNTLVSASAANPVDIVVRSGVYSNFDYGLYNQWGPAHKDYVGGLTLRAERDPDINHGWYVRFENEASDYRNVFAPNNTDNLTIRGIDFYKDSVSSNPPGGNNILQPKNNCENLVIEFCRFSGNPVDFAYHDSGGDHFGVSGIVTDGQSPNVDTKIRNCWFTNLYHCVVGNFMSTPNDYFEFSNNVCSNMASDVLQLTHLPGYLQNRVVSRNLVIDNTGISDADGGTEGDPHSDFLQITGVGYSVNITGGNRIERNNGLPWAFDVGDRLAIGNGPFGNSNSEHTVTATDPDWVEVTGTLLNGASGYMQLGGHQHKGFMLVEHNLISCAGRGSGMQIVVDFQGNVYGDNGSYIKIADNLVVSDDNPNGIRFGGLGDNTEILRNMFVHTGDDATAFTGGLSSFQFIIGGEINQYPGANLGTPSIDGNIVGDLFTNGVTFTGTNYTYGTGMSVSLMSELFDLSVALNTVDHTNLSNSDFEARVEATLDRYDPIGPVSGYTKPVFGDFWGGSGWTDTVAERAALAATASSSVQV